MTREQTIGKAERGNAAAWTGYATGQSLGSPFISPDLFNTVLMRLGATDFALGLFAVNSILALPVQLVAARVTDRARHKARLAVLAAFGYVVPILLPAGILLATGGRIGLWPFFAAVFLYYLASGLCSSFGGIVQIDLLSRVFRPGRRGTILGLQGSLAGLAGVLGGLGVAALLSGVQYPLGHACAWAFGVVLVGGVSLFLLRLRPLPGLTGRARRVSPSLRQTRAILFQDRRFLIFLVAVVARMGFSAVQYYLWPTARRLHGLPDEYVGYLASLSAVLAMVTAPVIGWLCDRLGRAGTALLFAGVAIPGFVLFPHAGSTRVVLAAYALIVVGTSGLSMPLFLSVMDLSPPDLRGTYAAIRYGTEGLVYAVLLPAFGFASTRFSPHPVFYVGAVLCAVAGLVLYGVADGRPRPGSGATRQPG